MKDAWKATHFPGSFVWGKYRMLFVLLDAEVEHQHTVGHYVLAFL